MWKYQNKLTYFRKEFEKEGDLNKVSSEMIDIIGLICKWVLALKLQ